MTPEQAAWTSLRPTFVELGLDPHRVENVLGEGTPDVNYSHGNIELKVLPKWPSRPGTRVKVPKFTGQQAGWLYRRWEAGGLSWLMVRITAGDWYLFDGYTAMEVYRGLTRAEWQEKACCAYPSGASREQLRAWLQWRHPSVLGNKGLDRFWRVEATRGPR